MNKSFFNHYMNTTPTNANEKYIFITDDKEIAQAIVLIGFKSVFLANEDNEHQYSLDTFIVYLNEIAFQGKCRTDYVYIPACSTKKANDKLEEYFKGEYLNTHQGWRLFKNKDYLANYDKSDELKKSLTDFIKRFEGKDEPQQDLMQFHHVAENGKITGAFDFAIFEHIKAHYHIFICGNPYIYESGVYSPDYQGTKLKKIIRGYLYPQFKKSRIIHQIYNLIVEADELQKSFDELNCFPKSYVNFQDCMLDVATMQEIPHDPNFYAVNQMPHKWREVSKAAEGAEIEKFFNFIFTSADDRQMLLEYAGLCLTVDTRQQRFLTLCGLGGTGKSVLIRLLEAAAGSKNVSNVAMQDLSKRFSTSLLVAKTLNSCADLSVEALEDSSTMKKLIGEDTLMAENKGQNAFMFRNYSKLLFSTNALPIVTAERTNGFFRRMLVLRMDRQPETPDIGLADKLLLEMPYFLKLSIKALHEMYQRGIITISENSKEAVLQMRKDSDVVEAWISEKCTVGAGLKVDRGVAFEDFKRYCEIEERQPLTRNGFFGALRKKSFAESRGKTERFFVGLSCGKVTAKSDGQGEFMTITQEQMEDLPFD